MRVGKASVDASLPPASVRWGAWLLMLGSAVGTDGVRARLPARPSGSVAGWANRPCCSRICCPRGWTDVR
jgi:hypothetical protein